MNIDISVDNSIAFESTQVESKDRNEKELEEQALNFADLLNNGKKSENISYQAIDNDENNTVTTFENPVDGKMVAVSLDNDIISKLEDYFGKDDIYRSTDGIVTLDNKAESYVASWFEDIAYKRNFFEADKNNDGLLSLDEYNQTKNNFEVNLRIAVNNSSDLSVDVDETISKTYLNTREDDEYTSMYRSGNRAHSIADELNMTLSINKDFDSKIDLNEAYSTNENITKEELLLAHVNSLKIEDVVRNKALSEEKSSLDLDDLSSQLNDVFSLIVALLLNEDDEKTKKILEKLKENNGDISTLSDYEKDIVKNVLNLKEPVDNKYDIEELERVMDIFKFYELKRDSLENSIESDINKIAK